MTVDPRIALEVALEERLTADQARRDAQRPPLDPTVTTLEQAVVQKMHGSPEPKDAA